MPSWPIHIALAKKLNKELNLGDDFIIGNILPDVLNGYIIKNPSVIINDQLTHLNEDEDLKEYIKSHNLKDPIVLGYASHILTDRYFNTYFHKHHVVKKDDKFMAILKDNTLFYDPNIKPWQIKHHDFNLYSIKLTNDGLLGDKINAVNAYDSIKLINEFPITKDDISKATDKINEFIGAYGEYDKNKYKMFTEEELDKLYQSCYEYLVNYLKEIV